MTLAVGDHVRLPRTYRDRDIYWWMNTIGLLDERYDAVDDLERARRLPSAQLIGTPERRTVDLNTLHAAGVEITGKLVGVTGDRAQFSGALANHVASADLKLGRLLDRIDRHVAEHDLAHIAPADRPETTRLPPASHRDPTRSLRGPSYGPPATGHTTPGSTRRSSTGGDGSTTKAA